MNVRDRHQIPVEWNRTVRDYPPDKCLHQLFEEQVERTPEAVAVVFEGRSLTYRELNARANQLGHHLRSVGVRQEVLVALCLERSIEMVVALLGILKAGGAYLPLEPGYPSDRLAFMLEDSQSPVVVTQKEIAAGLPVHRARVVCLDDGDVNFSPETNLANQTAPAHLAYVIFTSGSTGKPKGALITHHNVVRLMQATEELYGFNEQDVWTLFHSFAFDFSVWEIWGALLYGGRLIVVPYLLSRSPEAFYELLVAEKVTVLNQTPSAFRQLIQAEQASPRAHELALRYVIFGGEALKMKMLEPWFERHGDAHPQLVNMYGITETTVHVTHRRVMKKDLPAGSVIGVPISDLQVYVLDPSGRPVPIGGQGEMFVGGAGLALGYLNRPELTAERFVANPFSVDPNARLYRTGDLGRVMSDRDLEYLGRIDAQVKIRGHRIELGEISSVMEECFGVRQAIVLVQADECGGASLTAYLLLREGYRPSAAELRQYLREKLPDYMIPSRFFVVSGLPLTPNGKLDQQALGKLGGVELASGSEYVAPRNELESQMVGIWQAVLRRERAGIHDNFFDLGGHSLLAVVISSQISRQLNVEVPLSWIFEHPTIEQLARQLESAAEHGRETRPMAKANRHLPLPMSFAQQRMWLLQQTLPDPATYNEPVAYRMYGGWERNRVRRILQVIMERHEILRTALAQEQDELIQRVAAAGDAVLSWHEVMLPAIPRDQQQAFLQERLTEEARRSFDLAQAPLWRATWLEWTADEAFLLLTFHHGIVDEWSLRLFFHEFEKLYAADGRVARTDLPELPLQYADFAVWQRQRLTGPLLEKQKAYWSEHLKDLPPALKWPTDQVRPAQLSGAGAVHDFNLTGPVVTRLRALARQEETTLFTVMLAAFQVWLYRYSGQTDLVVGTPVANRESSEVQSLLGFFLNTLPIRVRLERSPTFREVLRQVRESLLGAFAHADLPFEQIVELAVRDRSQGQHPLYRVMFVLVEEGLPEFHLERAKARPMPIHTRTSKNDLTLSMQSAGEMLDCRIEYASDLFTPETSERMARHLTEVLHSIGADPEQPVIHSNFVSAPNCQAGRNALDQLVGAELAVGTDYLAPRNMLESKLVEIWQTVLRRERVGVQDNFFDLGGHSMLVVAIASQIANRLQMDVPLRWLFECATIEGLARRIGEQKNRVPRCHPIPMINRKQPLRMSFAQQRMWLLQQTLPDLATYQLAVYCRLFGWVDRRRVRRALQVILERHDVLRTALVQHGEDLVQQIAAAKDIPLPWWEVDLQLVPASQRQSALEERLLEEARRPFYLALAPLWRAVWITLAEEEQVLEIVFHHSIVDEWSLRLFFKEWQQLYAADGRLEQAELPELPVQYADYAVWERQRLTGTWLEQHRDYWREQLKDLPPALELPTDHARPVRSSGRGGVYDFPLSGPVVARLRELALEEGTTVFTVMLAAFHVWLYRYTGQTDVIVGTPVAQRERPEIQSLIGFFLNTLPIRTRLEGSHNFREVLRQVRGSLLAAFSHADLPFEQMVELAIKERDPGHQPLYQVMFVLLEEGLPAWRLNEVEARLQPVETRTSKNELTLSVEAVGETWSCHFEYATDLFTAETAVRMGRHLTELLYSISENSENSISQLNLMPESEQNQVLVEWNETARDYPRDKCIHRLFEEQVERTPNAVAVVFEGQSLTYGELNARANQLGHHLRSLGVGPEVLVGLCVERSLEMIVGLLGILKAGGAYVPIEPTVSRERLSLVLEDANSAVLLTQTTLLPDLLPTRAKVFRLDGDWPCLAHLGRKNPECEAGPDHLAYVIFTSGSTGRPKGVMVEHRQLVNYVTGIVESLALPPGLRYAMVSTFAADLGYTVLFPSLVTGGQLHVIAQDGASEPTKLAAYFRREAIEVLKIVPSHLKALLQLASTEQAENCLPRRTLVLGGEASDWGLIGRVRELAPACQIFNHYGPTETTVGVLLNRLNQPASGFLPATVPLGRPLPNARVYVVDALLQPKAVGLSGELLIGGSGVARGYLNRPELTAERFMADPFSSEPGARVYKTGDLARYLPDGKIEFCGRTDHQVKIRGYRIELGEVEAVLGRHPDLSACAVLARSDDGGNKALVAFVVSRARAQPTVGSLRQFLEETLPGYMIPSRFVMVGSLPLTPNGKVDRTVVEKLDGMEVRSDTGYVGPRNELESKLVEIWVTVLGREQVGIDDNFFDLGGHSLLAVRVQVRIELTLGVRLSLAAFFRAPTVRKLSELLRQPVAPDLGVYLAAPGRSQDNPPLFCLHFLSATLNLAKHLGSSRPVYGIESPLDEALRAWHDHGQVVTSIEDLAAYHLGKIKGVQPRGPYHLAGWCFGGVLAFEVAGQLAREGEEVAFLGLLDAFFGPGCRPKSLPWLRRLFHHGSRTVTEGPGYLSRKLRARRKIQERRKVQLEFGLTLPQAAFLRQVSSAYMGNIYPGGAVLFKTVAEPASFGFHPGQYNGWDAVIQGRILVEEVPCSHVEISVEPFVGEVARKLEYHLLGNSRK